MISAKASGSAPYRFARTALMANFTKYESIIFISTHL